MASNLPLAHDSPAREEARSKRLRLCAVLTTLALVGLVAGALVSTNVLAISHSASPLLQKLHRLDKRLEGRVIFPTDEGFSNACRVWNQISSLQPPPRAVVEVASQHDVQLALQVLASVDVPFSVRSGGHSKAGYSNAPDGIIISLSRLNHIEISQGSSNGSAVAKLGPAITSPEVLAASVPLGYAGVLGLCPTVAEGGFVLGGGFGIMSRKHGLGLDNLVSANVVLASSEMVVANSTHNSDLFWALRGAGIGNFGVVTEMSYELHRSQEAIVTAMMAMPKDQAPMFLERMASNDIPRELFMILETEGADDKKFARFFNISTTGRAIVALTWACPEPMCVETGMSYLRTQVATFVSDTDLRFHNSTTWLDNPAAKAPTSYSDLVQSFTGFLLAENATRNNLQIIVETFHNWTSEMAPYVAADVELWSGKISDVPSDATAFPHRSAKYNLGVVVTVPKDRPSVFANITGRLARDWHRIGRLLNGAYVNYQMASLGPNEYAKSYWGPHVRRLQEIKTKYDPGNLFKYPQGISTEGFGANPGDGEALM